jgi:hypothetical protein
MLPRQDVCFAAKAIEDAILAVAQKQADGDIGNELDFNSRLVARIGNSIDGFEAPSSTWRTTAIISGREGSEETPMGSGLVMTADIQTPTYAIQKSMLIQTRRLEPTQKMRTREHQWLKKQCADMLDLSADSFVFLYSPSKVTVVSAAAVEASNLSKLHDLYLYSPNILFEDFFLCWQGDPRLKANTKEDLAQLRTRARADSAILLRAASNS